MSVTVFVRLLPTLRSTTAVTSFLLHYACAFSQRGLLWLRCLANAGEESADERPFPDGEQLVLQDPGPSSAAEGHAETQYADDQLSGVEELEAMAAPREEFYRQAAEKIAAWYP